MIPYYSYPFVSFSAMNPTVQGMPAEAMQPVMPPSQATVPPVTPAAPIQPVAPMQPMNPMQPIMNPMQPSMPMMPICPFGGYPMPMPMPMETEMEDTDDMDDMSFEQGMAIDRQPAPILSNNPATTSIVLFKELTAYPNYGNPSGNADILYTGNRGTWTFDIPAFLFTPGNLRAQIVIRAVLDDHADVPVDRYSARITINGTNVHTGRLPLEHGVPRGGRFTNWRSLTFNIPNLRRTNRVVIVNTSTAGQNDWIAFDWMELRLIPR